ncbi:divergent polysaccharide deacetylase family protein [Orenia marismortui]|uniref:divergent polysaccharide deacetylase family protein n=1 Tax=Orenia marismortui TaxID=46469 RepID=UPI0003750DE6|nr:divergent polysaccharide deacetylase family protein [Orenia marismortui]
MDIDKLLTILLSMLLLLLLSACSQDSQPTTSNQDTELESIKVDYSKLSNQFDNKLDSILKEFNLDKEILISESSQKDKEVQREDYKFTWRYNYRKLEVPLFDTNIRLLSSLKDELINKLDQNFPIVKADWSQDESEQRLVIDIAFKAQSNSAEFKTHHLEFIQPEPKAKLAIVIDDWGFNRQGTEEMLSIERPLTMAVLPFRPYSDKDARLIRESDHELILHQPLEPTNPEVDPGKGAIYSKMDSKQIKEVFEKNLDSLVEVVGANHHMGSKASADSHVMKAIIEVLKKRDLFYLDSSTSQKSVGFETAKEYGVPTTLNYLFIDNIDKKEEVKKMILRLAKIALEKKELVIIGHVRSNTALAIQELIPTIEDMGVKMVYVSDLLE